MMPRLLSARLFWRWFAQFILLTVGALLAAISVILFQAPFDIAPGGISGIGIILNSLFGLPIGLIVLLGNIPIQLLAYRMLGGWRVIASTVYTVALYSVLIDVLTPYFPPQGLNDDVFLNALFGGIVGGIGAGLVYRGNGNLGGTSTLGRILQMRFGVPLSSSALYTDSAVILLAGLIFGWPNALYAMVALFVAGAVSDYVLEGPSVIRTAVIITDHPRSVADAILEQMQRGVTAWNVKGMYTETEHTALYVTVGRAQVNELRKLVFEVDPSAFVVVGQGHSAYGHGFRPVRIQPERGGGSS
jgi:uncharacterized membrane-anchored protein YitT (DUF2179 family)